MQLWGGRFTTGADARMAELNSSLPHDRRMGDEDVRGSLAWARGLGRAGVLAPSEVEQIVRGLEQVREELASGRLTFVETDEDIHTAVERRLGELIGPLAGKLHTGRSRNDQVATDFRLWVLSAIATLDGALREVQEALVGRAETDVGLILPGYTHLQRAQPVLLSHWWLSHFWPLQRDRERLADLHARTSVLPLGAGALAGAPFPVDRDALAADLGFAAVSPNSIDAVSDRDFAAEFLFCAALVGVHLSRLAEALILFTSAEFGFVELADAYATGSSLMPQKKNPDPLELARGKAGGLIGRLTGLLTTLKGLPSAYDKDLQEDKPPVFETFDTLALVLPVIAGLLATLTPRPERLRAALDPGLLATDLADYLVARGLPFREAHEVVGRCVRRALTLDLPLDRLPLAELQTIHPAFEADVAAVFDFERAVARRAVQGGTAPQAVQAQLARAREVLGM